MALIFAQMAVYDCNYHKGTEVFTPLTLKRGLQVYATLTVLGYS